MKLEDLTGQRFGRLTVLYRVKKQNSKTTYWHCKCDCGKEKDIGATALKSGNTKSCGCLHKQNHTTHGMHNEKIYAVWCAIIQRCFNPNNSQYKNYGGRGITMCDEWRNDFKSFYDWAYNNGYCDEKLEKSRSKLSIDRINNNGNYEPCNCRWVSQKVQTNNTRKNHFVIINGKSKTMQQWCDETGISKHTFYARYSKGLRGTDLILPVKTRKRR